MPEKNQKIAFVRSGAFQQDRSTERINHNMLEILSVTQVDRFKNYIVNAPPKSTQNTIPSQTTIN